MRLTYTLSFIILSLFFLSSCKTSTKPSEGNDIEILDLPDIIEKGELKILTMYSSVDYFKYRGQNMGLQYELSKQFANSLGVNLKVLVANSESELTEKLLKGEADLIAYNLPITKSLKDSLEYCGVEVQTHQVLIQQNIKGKEPIKDVTELIGKEIYVQPGKYYDRLLNLNEELGGGLIIHKIDTDSITLEDLITQVAEGKIEYTVADNSIAQLNKTYYPNLNIKLSISFDQKSSWAINKNTPKLKEAIDNWYQNNNQSPQYKASLKRYFEISKNSYIHSPIQSIEKGIISPYDQYFKVHAQSIDWDWRLLASLAYTESNFNKSVVSWAGAVGLMQLMPRTARAMGIPAGKEMDVNENIKGAVKYIGLTEQSFIQIKDKSERIKFVLASYNAGMGHVFDAMALAEKYEKNKYVWFDNVENYILLKSNREYFSDPVCKYGYFRGIETYNFVRDITARYEIYKQKVPI
ncbi:Lytic transglycosylase catalytic [Bacteroides coprosuis DSM 18011]|uniref:Lytic transglycosylase catalytic n=1 Tax=Bacteroides coprosuis DSM 18011 TaxID=679937 RepID=F3ZTD5_9BACE|nr:transporter substrate-binding domain-containing protein [Bacteroides coprosuis]EGJ71025.1 Lytic transglycosylase catalytic [Bacteroides coprosuis DSM 18011]